MGPLLLGAKDYVGNEDKMAALQLKHYEQSFYSKKCETRLSKVSDIFALTMSSK